MRRALTSSTKTKAAAVPLRVSAAAQVSIRCLISADASTEGAIHQHVIHQHQGKAVQVMPDIHARAKSEEAAFAMVMLVPVVATTRVGNIEAAKRSTRSSADALLARNGRRSLSVSLEAKKSAINAATTPAQATERSVPRAGSRVGRNAHKGVCAYGNE